MRLENDQIVAMNDFDARRGSSPKFRCSYASQTSREFQAVSVGDANYLALRKVPFRTKNSRRQQTSTIFSQRSDRAVVNCHRTARLIEERNPALSTGQSPRCGHEDGPFSLAGKNSRQDIKF